MYINVVFWGYNHDNGLKWLSHAIIVRVQDKQLLTTNITNHGCKMVSIYICLTWNMIKLMKY